MKFSKMLMLTMIVGFLVAGNAFAVTINDGSEENLQEIFDRITVGDDVFSSIDALGDENDALSDDLDSVWEIDASGTTAASFIIELTSNANSQTFGIYDIYDESKKIEIFSGSDTYNDGFNSTVAITMLADGSIGLNNIDTGIDFGSDLFGFYLGLGANSNVYYYSDSELNDGVDRMVAFQGVNDYVQIPGFSPGYWESNEFILGWEDGTDMDYQDLVVMVESVSPVPEPATMMLLGTGLIGLTFLGRNKFFK